MGGSQSTNITTMVNQTAAQVITQNMMNCSASSAQTQTVNITGSSIFGLSATQTASISQSCVANFQMTTDIANQIANQIQQQATSQSIALLDLVSGSKASNTVALSNMISSNVTTQLVQNAALSAIQTQSINVSGSTVADATISQSATVIQSAIMGAISNTNLATTVANNTSQSSSATQTNPLAFLTDYLTYIMIFIGIIVLAIIGGLIYVLSS